MGSTQAGCFVEEVRNKNLYTS